MARLRLGQGRGDLAVGECCALRVEACSGAGGVVDGRPVPPCVGLWGDAILRVGTQVGSVAS